MIQCYVQGRVDAVYKAKDMYITSARYLSIGSVEYE